MSIRIKYEINLSLVFFYKGEVKMIIRANTYKPNEILKFIRQNSNLTQKEFADKIGKSYAWQQSNEIGRANYYFKDLLDIVEQFNLEIIIQEKKK